MRLRQTALAAVLAAAAPLALAERSLLSLDEDGVEAGDCELEAGTARSRFRAAGARQRESAVQLACGIGWRSELTLAVARQRAGADRTDQRALELKTTLLPRRGGAVGWAVLGALADERATGRSWRRNDYVLAAEATAEPWREWLVEVQFGWARDVPARADRAVWTLGLEHALAGAWEGRLDIEGSDRHCPIAGASLRWAFWPDRAQLKFEAGRRLGGDRERKGGLALVIGF